MATKSETNFIGQKNDVARALASDVAGEERASNVGVTYGPGVLSVQLASPLTPSTSYSAVVQLHDHADRVRDGELATWQEARG